MQHACECGQRGADFCEVELLPALPADWDSGSVGGLATRCGIAVDMEWHKRQLTRAVLKRPMHLVAADAVKEIRLRYGGGHLGVKQQVNTAGFGIGSGILGWMTGGGTEGEEARDPAEFAVSHDKSDSTVTILRLTGGVSRPLILEPL